MITIIMLNLLICPHQNVLGMEPNKEHLKKYRNCGKANFQEVFFIPFPIIIN